MFEKYTRAARRAVFFARHEASQMGVECIDTEHLLLGVFRSDPPLTQRILKDPNQIRSIREQIEKRFPRGELSATSVDLPLTKISKTVLARAAKEAERDPNICPKHMLLALILVEECAASNILIANGVTAAQVELEASNSEEPEAGPVLVPRPAPSGTRIVSQYRDLTVEAREGKLSPLIGRERELESIVRILSRKDRPNPVLIGEPGVGKDALVRGLAQKIADGDVPANLDGRRIIAIEASSLPPLTGDRNAILYIHGLFDLPARAEIWSILGAQLGRGGLQCIATGTAAGYRTTRERADRLARHFEVVAVPPPDETETVRIAKGVKPQYEQFHGVTITDEAIDTAISASRWFLRHRELPDCVIDLLDEGAASVRLKRAAPDNIVIAQDIVETVAARANITPEAVIRAMQAKNTPLVASELAHRIPSGSRELAEALVTYLAGCTPEEAEQLCNAIRTAKTSLDRS